MSPAPAAVPQRIPRRAPDAPRPARAPHLRVVDDAARRRERRRRWIVRGWALGIVLAALAGVVLHALMAEGQVRVGRLATAFSAEEQRYENARLRVAELEAPDSIARRARRLGLVPASGTRTVGVPGVTPTPSSAPASATRAEQSVKQVLEEGTP
ncbi:MAG: hypothetical protein ACXVJX_13075 [Acidimicrobiia bacterium]